MPLSPEEKVWVMHIADTLERATGRPGPEVVTVETDHFERIALAVDSLFPAPVEPAPEPAPTGEPG